MAAEDNMADKKKNSDIALVISEAQSVMITWKIPEYFLLPHTAKYSMDCASFIFSNASWCIRLYPNGNGTASNTAISVVRLSSLVANHEMVCRVDFVTADGKQHEDDDDDRYFHLSFDKNCEKDCNSYIHDRSILVFDQKEYAPEGTMTFVCHLLCEESKDGIPFFSKASHKVDSSRNLCQDLKNLFLNGPNHDLTLKVKDREFRVHRSILSSRSQVFESMLNLDMKEKNSDVVDVPDCDPLAMEQLLIYLYCGEVDDLNKDNMLALYFAADKYDLKHLREECCDYIMKSLSCRNICDVVQLATNHSDRELLECATEFFVNNTKKILTTPEWMSFMEENAVAANELLIKASRKWTA